MNLFQVLRILRARWFIAFLILTITFSTTLLISWLIPKQYEASAQLYINTFDRASLNANQLPVNAQQSYLNTQISILISQRVLDSVISLLHMDKMLDVQISYLNATKGEGDFNHWLGEELLKALDIKFTGDSNIITITYSNPSLTGAVDIVTAFTQGFIGVNLQMDIDRAKSQQEWFQKNAEKVKADLINANAVLREFQVQQGLFDPTNEIDTEFQQYLQLSSLLNNAQSDFANAKGTFDQIKKAASETDPGVFGDPLINQLKDQFNVAEVELSSLKVNLGKNHPSVIQAQSKRDFLKNKLDEQLLQFRKAIHTAMETYQTQVDELAQKSKLQQNKVLALQEKRDTLSLLKRDEHFAEGMYELGLLRVAQSNLNASSPQTNIIVLSAPAASGTSSAADTWQHYVVSLFLGLIHGIATVLLIEFMELRVRTKAEVETILGLPADAVIELSVPKKQKQRVLSPPPAELQPAMPKG